MLTALGAPNDARAAALVLGPFGVDDIFETPVCSPVCPGGFFPLDWGVLREFTFALTPGDVVTDIVIEGVWGGTNQWSAPVEVYLGADLVATCIAADVCNTDPIGRVAWNGGLGFSLLNLGVDLANFQGDNVMLSVIQTASANGVSADLSDLQLTVHVERTCEAEICDGFDNDCDLAIDEDIAPIPTSCGVGECTGTPGAIECVSPGR